MNFKMCSLIISTTSDANGLLDYSPDWVVCFATQERLQPRIDFVVSTEGRDLPTCRRFLPSVEMTWLGVRG